MQTKVGTTALIDFFSDMENKRIAESEEQAKNVINDQQTKMNW